MLGEIQTLDKLLSWYKNNEWYKNKKCIFYKLLYSPNTHCPSKKDVWCTDECMSGLLEGLK